MDKLYYGAAFYPELWDENTIDDDIEMMKETGINIVRIGEFWWSRIEPNQENIDVTFIENILDKLYKNGIKVILCTPTATPPVWLTFNHDEGLHVDSMGRKMIHGSRQHVCTNNEEFRKFSRNIIEHIAKSVGNHPAVVLWQLDNEFKCHVSECFCESCKKQWHEWLKRKYETIDNLNYKWGTNVWSQTYENFEQIQQPFEDTPFIHNSSLSTIYRIFHREKIAEFAAEQAEIIRMYSNKPITTNAALGFNTDNELLFKYLDAAGFDTYASSKTPYLFTMNCDLWRNAKKGKEYYLLETSSSYTGALDRQSEVHPNGYLLSEAIADYALGGKAFCYWLWRQQPYGCEQNHSSILSAWGKPGVGYENVIKVRDEIDKIEDYIVNSKCCQAEVAITYSDRAKAFMMTESHVKDNYKELISQFYKNILNTGVYRDLIFEGASLDGYKILFTPFMYYMSKEYLMKAKAFVERGGIWIAGPLTGGRTEEHTINLDAALGKEFEEMAGVETLYTYPMENSGAFGEAFGVKAPLRLWSSVFKLNKAKRIGVVNGGITDGLPFITENKYGKGKIIMLGSLPYGESGDDMLKALVNYYCDEAKVSLKYEVSQGTLVIPRESKDGMYEFVINMTEENGLYDLKYKSFDVVNKSYLPAGKLNIKPYGYKVLKKV